jgi:hypothetical protein
MRTVTFSDAKVAEYVNANFIPLWFNRGKGFHNCEHRTEEGIFLRSAEAYTTKNICTFFLEPGGKVVHYFSGYYAPPVFLDLVRPLAALRENAGDEDVKRFHRERLRSLVSSPMAVSAEPFSYLGIAHAHGPVCAKLLAEAGSYLKRVHEQFVKDGGVPLDKVRSGYLFGNPFTEEPTSTAGFPKPQTPVSTAGGKR